MTKREFPTYAGTREEWAYAILEAVRPQLAAYGIVMPEGHSVRVGVVPIGRRGTGGSLGYCYSTKKSQCGTVNYIALCTRHEDPADLAHTLIHEYLHACDNCVSGHRHRWGRWAAAIGMQAKGHKRTTALQSLIDDALHAVGTPAAHAPSTRGGAVAHAALPSQVRVACPECGQHVYVPQRAYLDEFRVACGDCNRWMTDDVPAKAPRRGGKK